jgi:hypothetical protein
MRERKACYVVTVVTPEGEIQKGVTAFSKYQAIDIIYSTLSESQPDRSKYKAKRYYIP